MPRIRDKWYIGIDESNHGRAPEVFACVISPFIEDTQIYPQKRLTNYSAVWGAIGKRDFRFCLVNRGDYKRSGASNLLADVCSSLVLSLPQLREDPRPLEVYVDGELSPRQSEVIKDHLLDSLGKRFVKPISIFQVPKTKDYKTNYLILLADAIACYSFHRKTLDQLTNPQGFGKRRVDLIKH